MWTSAEEQRAQTLQQSADWWKAQEPDPFQTQEPWVARPWRKPAEEQQRMQPPQQPQQPEQPPGRAEQNAAESQPEAAEQNAAGQQREQPLQNAATEQPGQPPKDAKRHAAEKQPEQRQAEDAEQNAEPSAHNGGASGLVFARQVAGDGDGSARAHGGDAGGLCVFAGQLAGDGDGSARHRGNPPPPWWLDSEPEPNYDIGVAPGAPLLMAKDNGATISSRV